jgi:hypothetical protein
MKAEDERLFAQSQIPEIYQERIEAEEPGVELMN